MRVLFLQYVTTIILFGRISKRLLKINFSAFKPVLFSGVILLFVPYTQWRVESRNVYMKLGVIPLKSSYFRRIK